MTKFTIELDDEVRTSTCTQCGREYHRVHGFLYRDSDAWAVYWAALYKDHPDHADPRAVLTVALGDDWSETSEPSVRAWVQIQAWPNGDEIQMGFVDPEGTLDAQFGVPLRREAALSDPRKDWFLLAADEIVYHDSRVADVLGASK
jgi:hypothetical protein